MKRLNQEGKKIVAMKSEYLNNLDNEVVRDAIADSVKIRGTATVYKAFVEKDEASLINALAKIKKFQATEDDKFNNNIEEVRSKFDSYKIPHVVLIDEKKNEIRIRRFFGLDTRDLVKYFGVTKNEKLFTHFVSRELLEGFVNSKVRDKLIGIGKEASNAFSENIDGKNVKLQVEVSKSYRHEEYTSMFNVNYDIIIPYNEVDPVKVLGLAKRILNYAIREFSV
jgi:hypothetical protein